MTYRPRFQPEGLPGGCTLHGRNLTWANCTCLSFAMGIDAATLGGTVISGCQVRDETGDYIGGTTIEQNITVAAQHGVTVIGRTGPHYIGPYEAAAHLQTGAGMSVAGNLSALMHTAHKSNGAPVNHNVWVNEVRGGLPGHPKEALVYDPAANGRIASWGKAAQGPEWWDWGILLAFAAALEPAGDGTAQIGAGRWYAGLFPLAHLWGSDVSAEIRSADPSGQRTAAVCRKAHHDYASAINLADVKVLFKHYHLTYGTVINKADMQNLFKHAGV